MVRDPTSAHAHWDLSSDRINVALGPYFGGRAFLRLIGVPGGYLLAEGAVPIARGSWDVALPEADRSYMVELAVMRNYRWVVLARSNVIHAPPKTPRVATPAVVSRAPQPRGLAEGDGRELDSAGGHVDVAPTDTAPHAGQAGGGPAGVGASAQMGSEARLLGVDAESRLASELRSAQRGSEARLTSRELPHIPFVIAGRPGLPEPVAAALGGRGCLAWTRSSRRAQRRNRAGCDARRRRDLSRTRDRAPRPSGAGRRRARANRARYVPTGQ
jgi:hypothetical protein